MYLDHDDVDGCFETDFIPDLPDHKKDVSQKLVKYLRKYYMKSTSVYPPRLWAKKTSSLTMTTNNCESFHSHLAEVCKHKPHPNIQEFLQCLLNYQVIVYVKMRSTEEERAMNKPVMQRKNLIEDAIREQEARNLTNYKFVQRISEDCRHLRNGSNQSKLDSDSDTDTDGNNNTIP